MCVESVIRLPDQLTVEPVLADARFVAGNKQDRLALGIEGKGHPPFAICRAEAQLLHVCMARSGQRVSARPPQLRPEALEKVRQRQNLRPDVFIQRVELRLKLVADLNDPAHARTMALTTYDVKYIQVSTGIWA